MWREPEEFIYLLINNKDWLTKQIRQAVNNSLTDYYSGVSLYEWEESILKLIDSIIDTAKLVGLSSSTLQKNQLTQKESAKIFEELKTVFFPLRKKTFSLFISLLKLYRQTFLNLVFLHAEQEELNGLYSRFLERFFDQLELELLSEASFNTEDLMDSERSQPPAEISSHSIRYIDVFNNFFSPVILFDYQDNLLDYNKAAEELINKLDLNTGQSSDEPIGDRMIRLFQLQPGGFRIASEDFSLNQDSLIISIGARHFKVLRRRINDSDNRYRGVLVMLQDMTEQLETEMHLQVAKKKAEEADKLKTAFLANMSHEIRTPMNAILGFTELMLNEKFDNSDRTEYLKLVRKSSNDLLNIIEDIIDIAKIESKQMKIKYKPCKPYDLLLDLRVVFNETMHKFGIRGEVELILEVDKSDQDITIFTDGERLKQVISNLLNNAVKFTDHGSIKFGYRRIDESNIFFFVRDTGMGIPDNMKEKVFERFFQLEKTQALNVGGSGLGLAICKNIIQMLGGKIWLDSVEGKGTDFYFQIQCREVPRTSSYKENENTEMQEIPDWSDKQMLIAEDDEFNFIFLREILSKTGVKILRAKNGLEAINSIETVDNIDLVLMDIKMPEVDGLEAARYISSIRPEIPIIAQTAYAMEDDRIKCMNAGCSSYITKPVDGLKLFQLIQGNLKLHKNVRERSSSC
jgi:signal transduction histidine kinase/ActR/RegA family two-component response regulator